MSKNWKKFIPGGLTITLLSVVAFAAICCRIVFIASEPQDLSDIAGYSELKGGTAENTSELADPPRDLLKVLNQADYLGETVEITESELNRYINITLSPKQNGMFNLITRIDGVWVRLRNQHVELVIERRIQGYKTILPHQISYFVKLTKDGEVAFDGGEIYGGLGQKAACTGQLKLPNLALPLVSEAAKQITKVYEKELEYLTKKAARLEINEDRILYVGRGTGRPK